MDLLPAPPPAPFVGLVYEAGSKQAPLISTWHFTPPMVISGGAGWLAGSQRHSSSLDRVRVGEQRRRERLTARKGGVTALSAPGMAL